MIDLLYGIFVKHSGFAIMILRNCKVETFDQKKKCVQFFFSSIAALIQIYIPSIENVITFLLQCIRYEQAILEYK